MTAKPCPFPTSWPLNCLLRTCCTPRVIGQSQTRRQVSSPEGIELVRQYLGDQPGLHRTGLADLVCREMGFVDARGEVQRGGRLKALRVLEQRGHFVLAVPRSKPGPSRPRRLDQGVPCPNEVPTSVGRVRGLRLVLVETEEQMCTWNTMLDEEHPQGSGPLVGRQLRYLVDSEHGWLGGPGFASGAPHLDARARWLGGLGFASGALHLDARARWIGWDAETRLAYLDRVVGMARFLVRPSVRCKNLASRQLGMVPIRLTQGFEARYGYVPWVLEAL